jgi:hypothetical protein
VRIADIGSEEFKKADLRPIVSGRDQCGQGQDTGRMTRWFIVA